MERVREEPPCRPLKVLIVGAGIGGLTAALGLRKQGHEVAIFERSELAQETGAALHLASNSHGILRRLGIYPETFGANPVHGLLEFDYTGSLRTDVDLQASLKQWQNLWVLSHRVRLHEALKDAATAKQGTGKPALLRTSSRIIGVDPAKATVRLEDGTEFSGDLVIGADGVGSVTRKLIAPDMKPFGSGKSAFRFMIPHNTMRSNPLTKDLADRKGYMTFWYANDRRVVMYPCNNNTVMNCLAIYPSQLSKNVANTSGNDWDQHSSKQLLLDLFNDFDPRVQVLFGMTDEKTLKSWTLLDMERLPRWVEGQLVLLGDAAHPFLPYQGQGAGIAIEDAASLSALLPAGTPVEDLPSRLALYEKLRDERAHRIQEYTRVSGSDLNDQKRNSFNVMEFVNYNLGHDEYHNSEHALKKLLWSRNSLNTSWRLPLAFGPMQSPRQDLLGRIQSLDLDATTKTHSIRFKTSATYLKNWFPTSTFSFASPGTVAEATFRCVELQNLKWLGRWGYNYWGLWIHGVKYTCKDGAELFGSFLPVLFENEADPIITGREDLGMPKLFCDIDVGQKENGDTSIDCSWRRNSFATMELGGLEERTGDLSGPPCGIADDNLLLYRYIPAVGEPGKADAEYPVIVEHGKSRDTCVVTRRMTSTRSKVEFRADDATMNALPTIGSVVAGLAGVPVYSVLEACTTEAKGLATFSQARRIE